MSESEYFDGYFLKNYLFTPFVRINLHGIYWTFNAHFNFGRKLKFSSLKYGVVDYSPNTACRQINVSVMRIW